MGQQRRKYTKEFKKETVELLLRPGNTASQLASEREFVRILLVVGKGNMKNIRKKKAEEEQKIINKNIRPNFTNSTTLTGDCKKPNINENLKPLCRRHPLIPQGFPV